MVSESLRTMSFKKIAAILAGLLLTFLLLAHIKQNGLPSRPYLTNYQLDTSNLITRLRHLDIKFHKFIALTHKQHGSSHASGTSNPEESVVSDDETTPNPEQRPTVFPRWRIDKSFYPNFLDKYKLKTNSKCRGKFNMLVLIQSYISHGDRRNSIRKSWGNCTTNNPAYKWKVLFIIGTTKEERDPNLLSEEMFKHNDLLFFKTGESFYNLTEKLQKSFQWITRHCDFRYLLKADDDVFVNMGALYDYLGQERMPKTELFTGQVMWWSEVYRDGRYAIDKGYPRAVYPRYCSGGGYILSHDVVMKFVKLFPYVPYMRIDDAYFGELALKSGIHTIHSDNFRMWSDGCDYKDTGIVTHPVKDDKCMSEMYAKSAKMFARIGS